MKYKITILGLLFILSGCNFHSGSFSIIPVVFPEQETSEEDFQKQFTPKMNWINDNTLEISVTILEVFFIPSKDDIFSEIKDDEIILKYNIEIPDPTIQKDEKGDTYNRRILPIRLNVTMHDIEKKYYSLTIISNKTIRYK